MSLTNKRTHDLLLLCELIQPKFLSSQLGRKTTENVIIKTSRNLITYVIQLSAGSVMQ